MAPKPVPADEYAPEIATGLAADGTFLVEGLAPGSYEVTAMLHGDDVTYPLGLGSVLASGMAEVAVGDGDGVATSRSHIVL